MFGQNKPEPIKKTDTPKRTRKNQAAQPNGEQSSRGRGRGQRGKSNRGRGRPRNADRLMSQNQQQDYQNEAVQNEIKDSFNYSEQRESALQSSPQMGVVDVIFDPLEQLSKTRDVQANLEQFTIQKPRGRPPTKKNKDQSKSPAPPRNRGKKKNQQEQKPIMIIDDFALVNNNVQQVDQAPQQQQPQFSFNEIIDEDIQAVPDFNEQNHLQMPPIQQNNYNMMGQDSPNMMNSVSIISEIQDQIMSTDQIPNKEKEEAAEKLEKLQQNIGQISNDMPPILKISEQVSILQDDFTTEINVNKKFLSMSKGRGRGRPSKKLMQQNEEESLLARSKSYQPSIFEKLPEPPKKVFNVIRSFHKSDLSKNQRISGFSSYSQRSAKKPQSNQKPVNVRNPPSGLKTPAAKNQTKSNKMRQSSSDQANKNKMRLDSEKKSTKVAYKIEKDKQFSLPVFGIKKEPNLMKQGLPKQQRLKNARPIPREILDEFVRLNFLTLQWQQQNSAKNVKSSPNNTFMKNTMINKDFRIYVLDSKWLNNLRAYIYQCVQIYNGQLDFQLDKFSPDDFSQLAGKQDSGQNQKRHKQKKQSQKAAEDPNTVLQMEKEKQQILKIAAKKFHESNEYLDNWNLLETNSGASCQNGLKYIYLKDQSAQVDKLNTFLKKVSEGDTAKDKQTINFKTDFEIILPQFHLFLINHQALFGIDMDLYQPILRQYVREEKSIRSSLELNFTQFEFKIQESNQSPQNVDKVFRFQTNIYTSLYEIKNRLQKMLKDYNESFNFAHFCIDSPNNLTDSARLKDILEGFEEKQLSCIQLKYLMNKCGSGLFNEFFLIEKPDDLKESANSNFYQAVSKKQAFQLTHVTYCNYCRVNIFQQKQKLRNKESNLQLISCFCKKIFYCCEKCKKDDLKYHKQVCQGNFKTKDEWLNQCNDDQVIGKGLTGLQNLTNSCYMNCTLQCLSHCKALTNYFLKGVFIHEINTSNPLGAQGMICIAYGKVLQELWTCQYPVVIPQKFKSVISRFKKQFSNQEQQDSQELLTIILDSLHEDLNRVKIKPLVPMIESHGENDEKASLESWEAHLKRSQSIIVDLMHGQFKSTVRCPELDCNHLSITFEAFMNISLPIPEIKLITKQFVWVPFDISKKCSIHKFTIKGHESIKNLRKYLTCEILSQQDLCNDENKFEIVLIYKDQIHRLMCDSNMAIGLQNQDLHLFLFEIEDKAHRDVLSFEEGDDTNQSILLNEIHRRYNRNFLMSFLNIQIVNHQMQQIEDDETFFPRLSVLNLDSTLIEIHLEIFSQLKYIFTRFLELKDQQLQQYGNQNSTGNIQNEQHLIGSSLIEQRLFYKKLEMEIPMKIDLEKWNKMTLTEQYELVFSNFNQSFHDPSRRKPKELPYFLRVVCRKAFRECGENSSSNDFENSIDKKQKPKRGPRHNSEGTESIRCIFCLRKKCTGCPLPFEDKMSLRDFLLKSKSPTTSFYFYKDDDEFNIKTQMNRYRKHNQKKAAEGPSVTQSCKKQSSTAKKSTKKNSRSDFQYDKEDEQSQQDENQDFQILLQFNKNSCWGLFELLVRGQNQRLTVLSQIQLRKQQLQQEESPLKVIQKHQLQQKQFFIDKVTIADCFRQFNKPEKLSWQNEWYCDKCKQHKQAVKKIQVYKTPPILIITLKRFKGSMTNQKQNTPVFYPITDLNMKNFMINSNQKSSEQMDMYEKIMNDQIYDLFAVVLHTGTLNAGHYTSLAKNKDNWYEFNDHQVIKLNKHEEERVVSNHAYILFYQKRGIDFDNIQNYDNIRNDLIQHIDDDQVNDRQIDSSSLRPNGGQQPNIQIVEKFVPQKIRFPIIVPEPEIEQKDKSSPKMSIQEEEEENIPHVDEELIVFENPQKKKVDKKEDKEMKVVHQEVDEDLEMQNQEEEQVDVEQPNEDQEMEEPKEDVEIVENFPENDQDQTSQQNENNPNKLISQYPFEKGGKILDDFHGQIFERDDEESFQEINHEQVELIKMMETPKSKAKEVSNQASCSFEEISLLSNSAKLDCSKFSSKDRDSSSDSSSSQFSSIRVMPPTEKLILSLQFSKEIQKKPKGPKFKRILKSTIKNQNVQIVKQRKRQMVIKIDVPKLSEEIVEEPTTKKKQSKRQAVPKKDKSLQQSGKKEQQQPSSLFRTTSIPQVQQVQNLCSSQKSLTNMLSPNLESSERFLPPNMEEILQIAIQQNQDGTTKKRGPGRPRKIKTLEEIQYEQNNPRKRRKKNVEIIQAIDTEKEQADQIQPKENEDEHRYHSDDHNKHPDEQHDKDMQ